jgi:hypothetical protein
MESNEYINMPKLYKRQALDLMMFGFVNGMQSALPSMSLKNCLVYFQKRHNLSEDDYNLDSARITYYRMQKDFKESL